MTNLLEQLQAALVEGNKYKQAGQLEKALDRYLYVFDSGCMKSTVEYDIALSIVDLGQNYPPAREALLARRNSLELSLKSGDITHKSIRTWRTLNKILKEGTREISLLLEMQQSGVEDTLLFREIVSSNVAWFLQNQSFDILEKYLNDLGRNLFSELGELEGKINFPKDDYSDLDHDKEQVRKIALLSIEIALSCNRLQQADIILKRVMSVFQDLETLKALTDITTRSGGLKQKSFLLDTIKQLYPQEYSVWVSKNEIGDES